MLFKDYTYSVLIVSSSEKFVGSIRAMLPENEFGPIEIAKNIGVARRRYAERGFDVVLINTPLPDEFGTKFALDVSADTNSGVLMFIKSDLYDDITEKVIDYGVLTVSKPISASMVHQVFKILYAVQEKFRGFEKKTATLEEKMEEIRIINRAKWTLINNLKMTESEAHRLIEKQALDTRRTKRSIAEGIINTYNS